MFKIRCGNAATKYGDNNRMYPARQIRSTLYSCRTAATCRSYASRSSPFEGISRVSIPRAFARSNPRASGLLLMTMAISALGMRPAATLSASASKFEPRPLKSTPMRFVIWKKLNTPGHVGQMSEPCAHESACAHPTGKSVCRCYWPVLQFRDGLRGTLVASSKVRLFRDADHDHSVGGNGGREGFGHLATVGMRPQVTHGVFAAPAKVLPCDRALAFLRAAVKKRHC